MLSTDTQYSKFFVPSRSTLYILFTALEDSRVKRNNRYIVILHTYILCMPEEQIQCYVTYIHTVYAGNPRATATSVKVTRVIFPHNMPVSLVSSSPGHSSFPTELHKILGLLGTCPVPCSLCAVPELSKNEM